MRYSLIQTRFAAATIQQQKPETGTEDTPAPTDETWRFIQTTSTWHEGPSTTCRGTCFRKVW